jgi:hypothetical protein
MTIITYSFKELSPAHLFQLYFVLITLRRCLLHLISTHVVSKGTHQAPLWLDPKVSLCTGQVDSRNKQISYFVATLQVTIFLPANKQEEGQPPSKHQVSDPKPPTTLLFPTIHSPHSTVALVPREFGASIKNCFVWASLQGPRSSPLGPSSASSPASPHGPLASSLRLMASSASSASPLGAKVKNAR